jgi:addiction module RelE/StbE family toxin
MEVIWTRRAQRELRDIRNYVAVDKPDAAERLAIRIVALVEALRLQPRLGRPGLAPGTRELIVGGTPYTIVYRVRGQKLTIASVWHGARHRNH